jgi:pimeloyl-ACP methyl ester carboxylesterase
MATHVVLGAQPPIVFVAQLGGAGDGWLPVIDRLVAGSATVRYDRPGTGEAPARPAPNPPLPYSVFAEELAALLDQHGVVQPAVLVGHSIGGHIARAFVDRWPTRCTGLVFVDASIPQFKLWSRDTKPVIDGDVAAGATEFDILAGEVELLSATIPPVPTVVITRRRHWWMAGETMPHPAIDDLWQVSQQLLAQQCNAPLLVAEHAGHQVPSEAPALVVCAVEAVVHAVRAGASVIIDPAAVSAAGGTHLIC